MQLSTCASKCGVFRKALRDREDTGNAVNQAFAQAMCEEHSAAPARPFARLERVRAHTESCLVNTTAPQGLPAGVGLSWLERGAPVRSAAGLPAGSPQRSARSGCRRPRLHTPARAAACRQQRSRCSARAEAVHHRTEQRCPPRGTPGRALASERRVRWCCSPESAFCSCGLWLVPRLRHSAFRPACASARRSYSWHSGLQRRAAPTPEHSELQRRAAEWPDHRQISWQALAMVCRTSATPFSRCTCGKLCIHTFSQTSSGL